MTRWFATAPTARWVFQERFTAHLQPVGLTHAKTMGTARTACGRSAASWPKLWELTFELPLPRGAQPCPACVGLTVGAAAS